MVGTTTAVPGTDTLKSTACPDASVAVHFLEPRRKLGATAVFSGRAAAAGPVKIRLEPVRSPCEDRECRR